MPHLIDIIKASKNVYRHLSPTPLRHYPQLSAQIGTELWLKHENHNPTCAFKVRGGIHCIASLTSEQKSKGIYTASTGNHGQSIAYAGQVFGVKTHIFVPKGANAGKVDAIKSLGAQIEFCGDDFDQSRAGALDKSTKNGGIFIGPTDDILIQGVGSYAMEIMRDLPDTDAIIVPVGAGSGICATAIVAKSINPNIQVIGVQSAQSPSQQLSWKNKKLLQADNETIAEGMATGVAFANTQEIMLKHVDQFILVDDQEIISATKTLIETTHNLIEEASASTFAAALKLKNQLHGKKTVLVITGGNIAMNNLAQLFS